MISCAFRVKQLSPSLVGIPHEPFGHVRIQFLSGHNFYQGANILLALLSENISLFQMERIQFTSIFARFRNLSLLSKSGQGSLSQVVLRVCWPVARASYISYPLSLHKKARLPLEAVKGAPGASEGTTINYKEYE